MAASEQIAPAAGASVPPPSFGDAVWTWLRIGCLSFGGPVAQIAMMHRVVVEEKKWIDEPRYLHALNFCMLLPGPEAQQLATYVGWVLHGLRGGLAAGLLFILPGALFMLGLSFLYMLARGLPLVDGALAGIKAAVLVIVVEAVIRIGKRGLKTWLLIGIAAVAFLAIFVLALPFPLIVIGAALIGFLVARRAPGQLALQEAVAPPPPTSGRWAKAAGVAAAWLAIWWAPVVLAVLLLGSGHMLVQLGLFFSKLAVVSFGGAYALLAYMAQQVVEAQGWLAPGEMIDALGLAETTPGPLILVTQFVAFVAAWRFPAPFDPALAAVLGAAMATWTVFTPSFLWIFVGAPFIEYLRSNRALAGALAAITAAVVGVILNLAVWFTLNVLFGKVTEANFGPLRLYVFSPSSLDIGAAVMAVIAAALMFRLHLGLIATVSIMAALGVAARLVLG